MNHYSTVQDAVGNTPLVRLQRLPGVAVSERGNIILGKLEGNNPAGSVKDRPALSMILGAEARGEIKPHERIVIFNTGAAQKYPEAVQEEIPLLDISKPIDWEAI